MNKTRNALLGIVSALALAACAGTDSPNSKTPSGGDPDKATVRFVFPSLKAMNRRAFPARNAASLADAKAYANHVAVVLRKSAEDGYAYISDNAALNEEGGTLELTVAPGTYDVLAIAGHVIGTIDETHPLSGANFNALASGSITGKTLTVGANTVDITLLSIETTLGTPTLADGVITVAYTVNTQNNFLLLGADDKAVFTLVDADGAAVVDPQTVDGPATPSATHEYAATFTPESTDGISVSVSHSGGKAFGASDSNIGFHTASPQDSGNESALLSRNKKAVPTDSMFNITLKWGEEE
jgi:hypothetical protein